MFNLIREMNYVEKYLSPRKFIVSKNKTENITNIISNIHFLKSATFKKATSFLTMLENIVVTFYHFTSSRENESSFMSCLKVSKGKRRVIKFDIHFKNSTKLKEVILCITILCKKNFQFLGFKISRIQVFGIQNKTIKSMFILITFY